MALRSSIACPSTASVPSRPWRSGPTIARPATATRVPLPLDAISKAIIEQLQQDGRRTYAKIGEAVGLSEAAVRQRVNRLVDAGVMQIVAVTNPLQLGFRRQAMIGIKAEGTSIRSSTPSPRWTRSTTS